MWRIAQMTLHTGVATPRPIPPHRLLMAHKDRPAKINAKNHLSQWPREPKEKKWAKSSMQELHPNHYELLFYHKTLKSSQVKQAVGNQT
jgi:hypothetical protein